MKVAVTSNLTHDLGADVGMEVAAIVQPPHTELRAGSSTIFR